MKREDAILACEETVRRFDPDRYFASLFAPANIRPFLFALYAFNHEIARLGERSHEPLLGAVRLQWWREAVDEAREGRPRAHPAAIGLVELFASCAPPRALFDALLDAREFGLTPDMFPDPAALEAYCEATSSGLMRIAASVLGAHSGLEPFLRHAGVAYAITGLLRAIPFHAARRRLYLPIDLLEANGLSAEDVFAGKNVAALKQVVGMLGERARAHISSARADKPDRIALRAALPAALVPGYLRRMTARDFDPFRNSPEVPLFRRQLILLRAATFGRL